MAREKPVFLTLRNHSYRDYRESSKFGFSNSLHFKSYGPFKHKLLLALCLLGNFICFFESERMGETYITFGVDPSIHKVIIDQSIHPCSLFELLLYIQVNNFSVMLLHFLNWTSNKQRIKCLTEGHNTEALMWLEPGTPRSQVKHSTLSYRALHPLHPCSLISVSVISSLGSLLTIHATYKI